MTKPAIVFCADDFTGASDTLATLARQGLSARLFLKASAVEDAARREGLDAIGIASSLRAMQREEARTAMIAIAAGLATIGAPMAHFKICSTFDSSPDIGNICVAADVFAKELDAGWIAVIGGQPSLRRYCLFGNLFAAAGDGAVYRIDRHPTMSRHPITPMAESDMRLHLAKQGWDRIGLVDFAQYKRGASSVVADLVSRIDAGERYTLFDVSCDADLSAIGEILKSIGKSHKTLCVGASSVAQAMFGNVQGGAALQSDLGTKVNFDGPIFAFAGSRSAVTAAQVERAKRYRVVVVSPDVFIAGNADLAKVSRSCREGLADGENVLVQVSSDRHGYHSGRDLANATANFIGDVVVAARPGCLAIAGGDTSSAAIAHLGIESISAIADFDSGAPLIRAHSKNSLDKLPMILKGGQVGSIDMFDKLANYCGMT